MDKIIIEKNAGTWLFLISFHHKKEAVICNEAGFKEAIERFDNPKGLKSVKYLSGEKWKRMSISEVRQHFSWNTETDIFLSQHYYFGCSRTKKR